MGYTPLDIDIDITISYKMSACIMEEIEHDSESKSSFVYLLISSDEKATYVGATVDLEHRLRQHNKEIKGGAHATGIKVGQGKTWRRACYVSGFPTWQAALQFEWRWKQLGRQVLKKNIGKDMRPLERRMESLKQLLALPQSTSKAIPYSEWKTPPEVHME
jgi:structure-specific endonuclease subunit SLX1